MLSIGRGHAYAIGYLDALVRYFEYVKGLAFEQTPDYDFIRKIFK